jgi:predicted Zn-dependent protease
LLLLVTLCFAIGSASAYSIAKEIELGKQASEVAQKEMPLSENKQWQADIEAMGQKFMPYISRKQIQYHFHIVSPKDPDELNAFALPGGYVYFTERMWKIMTPDERASVMAHEIIHCDRRHGVDMMIKSQQRALWVLPVAILSGGVALGEMVMMGNLAISQRYSRKMEREADELGIKLLASAGFNPAGTVTSMKKLLYIESDSNRYEVSALFASHPDTQKRLEYLTSLAKSLGAKDSDFALKMVNDPSRLGNIIEKTQGANIAYAKTTVPLDRGLEIDIRKMLWDDKKQAITPQTIATAKVMAGGYYPILVLEKGNALNLSDIMPGDGIFLSPPPSINAVIENQNLPANPK